MPGVRWDTTPGGLALPPGLVGPCHPCLLEATAVTAANRIDMCKVVCPRPGTLKGVCGPNGPTLGGNIRFMVLNADRSSILWDSGAGAAQAGANAWQSAPTDPNLAVQLGDVLWLGRQTNSATATFPRVNTSFANLAQLPAAMNAALGGDSWVAGFNTPGGGFINPTTPVTLTGAAMFPLYAYIV